MRRTTVLALLTIACLTTATRIGAESVEERVEARVFFVVRHAEKEAGGRDPSLSAAGAARVKALRAALRDAGVGQVHSTDYARTRQTAAALSDTPTVYDPRKLDALVAKLKGTAGRHLVVGHSNTTPDVVLLFRFKARAPIYFGFGAAAERFDPGPVVSQPDPITEYGAVAVVGYDLALSSRVGGRIAWWNYLMTPNGQNLSATTVVKGTTYDTLITVGARIVILGR